MHIFADELISLDKAVGGVLADIAEQLRKFGIRLHVISSTAGSPGAIRIVAAEWHDKVNPVLMAELPRCHYCTTVMVGGQQIKPHAPGGHAGQARAGSGWSGPPLRRSAPGIAVDRAAPQERGPAAEIRFGAQPGLTFRVRISPAQGGLRALSGKIRKDRALLS